jgi:hypothetical protein
MPGDCWIGWDSVGRTHIFIWPFGFRGSVAKLCWLFPPCDVISRSMVKSASGECHGCRVLENCIGGLSLFSKEELALWFLTCSIDMVRRATVHEKFKVRPCRVKTQGLALIGCAWQLPFWRHCFMSADFSPGWKPKIYDRATTVLVHCSLLGGVAFWKNWNFGAVLVVLVLMLQGI